MTPSLPIPTDNIYKFSCIFGLALIVASIFSYVSIYVSSLDRKAKYMEVIIPLEDKAERSKAENNLLELNNKLIEIVKSNEKTAADVLGSVIGIGIVLSAYGAWNWRQKIQTRDDKIAELQIDKLKAEVDKLRAEIANANRHSNTNESEAEQEGIAHEA